MAVLPIVVYPHPVLQQVCKASELTDEVRRLADDMMETMQAAGGIGLAAPQVGKPLRLIVADVSPERAQPIKLFNPTVIAAAGSHTTEEGCLSLPGVRAAVRRPQTVTVQGLDMDGREQRIDATELLAVCLQHEIDHLNGVLFFDRLSALRRRMLLTKYNKLQK